MAYKQWQMLLLLQCIARGQAGAHCATDPELDLCDTTAPTPRPTTHDHDHAGHNHTTSRPTPRPTPAPTPATTKADESVSGAVRQAGGARGILMMLLTSLAMGRSAHGGASFALPLVLASVVVLNPLGVESASAVPMSKCGDIKSMYKDSGCCGNAAKVTNFQVVPMHQSGLTGTNICAGKKPAPGSGFDNIDCTKDGITQAFEQSGTDVTKGYKGNTSKQSGQDPITTPYYQAGLCPVNVHWHLGTEHRSAGEYDENQAGNGKTRRLAAGVRKGFSCKHYDKTKSMFTTEYAWKYCVGMHVGETYEVHWPHSVIGDCGTPNQWQTPFYDGVLCHISKFNAPTLSKSAGVQAQIFTIVNDEKYFYPDLMRGMIVEGAMGTDMSYYTGSTTGTSRNNKICSAYTPITWQVDRKCHLISASSFDKMCADMLAQRDDMSGDLHAHGARELVADEFASNNHQRL